jgi:hypothetical protein
MNRGGEGNKEKKNITPPLWNFEFHFSLREGRGIHLLYKTPNDRNTLYGSKSEILFKNP